MRKLLILTTLIFSVMFSSTSFAEWKKVNESVDAMNYVDFERIRKVDGYVYWWGLNDYLKPIKQGHLSGKMYIQSDCKLFRWKGLSWSFHKEPMGGGTPSSSSNTPEKEWRYPFPDSSVEEVLKSVCEYAK